MPIPSDADAAALLMADWGRPAIVSVRDPEATEPQPEWAGQSVTVVVSGRDLSPDEGGHRHYRTLTVLMRTADIPTDDRTRWLLSFVADPHAIAPPKGAADPVYEPVSQLRVGDAFVRVTLRAMADAPPFA